MLFVKDRNLSVISNNFLQKISRSKFYGNVDETLMSWIFLKEIRKQNPNKLFN